MSDSDSDSSVDVEAAAEVGLARLLPEKSKAVYETAYKKFDEWRTKNNIQLVDEQCMLAYFSQEMASSKPSTKWSQYSMLKTTINMNMGIHIGDFEKLALFLKRRKEDHCPKKSEVLTKEQIFQFLKDADDFFYLATKVVMIVGVYGACRREEILRLSMDDIEDMEDSVRITIRTKIKVLRQFVITKGNTPGVDMLKLFRSYAQKRPAGVTHSRFFVGYRAGKCSKQPIGINSIGKMPTIIAEFLKLPSPQDYTGHCFRRSSASLPADSGVDICILKRYGGWKSSAVTEGHLENSFSQKQMMAESNSNFSGYFQPMDGSSLLQNKELREIKTPPMSVGRSVCRTCRKEDNISSFLPVEAESLTGKTVADMIYEISDILVRLDSHLPQNICLACVEQLEAAYNFRQKCIDSNAILTKQFDESQQKQFPAELRTDYEAESATVKLEIMDQESLEDDESTNDHDDQSFEKKSSTRLSSQRPRKRRAAQSPREQKKEGSVTRMKRGKRRTYRAIALDYIDTSAGKWQCNIDKVKKCEYRQDHYDACNFIRHFRQMHLEAATKLGLMREMDDEIAFAKRKRAIAKRSIAIDARHFVAACIRLIAIHNLPLHCFEWTGLRMLLDPISDALGVSINSNNIKMHMHTVAGKVIDGMQKEMVGKLVSIKIDSVSRIGRHVLSIYAQYEMNHEVVIRTLGSVELKETYTAKYLKSFVLDALRRYELSEDQIFAIFADNGANMIANAKKLQKLFFGTVLHNEQLEDSETDCNERDRKEKERLDALLVELNDQFCTVSGAVCTLQHALNEVVQNSDSNVIHISDFVKNVRKTKYRNFFESEKASYPPLWTPNRWCGKYKTIRGIVKQERFFTSLCSMYAELSLTEDDWKFLKDYDTAFRPLYSLTKLMQEQHQTFPEFYMQWLLIIKEIRGQQDNRFTKPLVESLTKALVSLKDNAVFKAALYLDPRFNYLNSAVFSPEQKEEIQHYIVNIWNRICNLTPSGSSSTEAEPSSKSPVKDDMDEFFAEMFGGSLNASKSVSQSNAKPIIQQLKMLETEARQPHDFDVWNHWVLRKASHPELFGVAMVVFAMPSNQISVERAFSALALSGRETELPEATLEDILLLKLNDNLLDGVISVLYDWKKFAEQRSTSSFEI